jgi:DNA-binding transcriptional ArsR family regulator
MARLATTSDVFNAIAEPQRREILNLLALRERSVNDIAARMNVAQPRISKHLRVLRQVNLVSMRGAGSQRLYRASGAGLKPIHDWTKTFERHWTESLDRLDHYLRDLQDAERAKDSKRHGRTK